MLDQLRRTVDRALAGRGHLLLLAGEAGIGKTTLLTELSHYAAARGARVAWGWGWPGEGAPGYWPWVQVMRALGLDTPLSAAGLSTTGLSTTGAGRARPARDREPHVVAARPDRDAGAGGQARLLGDQAERARKTVTARIRAGRRAERFRGTPDLPAYFRQPCGPGWALVGDAGLLLDPITGQGIGHAFRDAELLADAVADGLGGIRPLGQALGQYHRARDKAARPMYDFTARLAALDPPAPAKTALFRALSQRQDDSDAFVGTLTGSVPLREFMSPKNMIRLVGVRGFTRLMLSQGRPRPGNPAGQDVGQPTAAVLAED